MKEHQTDLTRALGTAVTTITHLRREVKRVDNLRLAQMQAATGNPKFLPKQ